MQRLDNVLAYWLGSPAPKILLFIPYLALYLIFWFLKLPISLLSNFFLVLHVAIASYLMTCFVKSWRRLDFQAWFFWIGLFAFFAFIGAYLEFPSDGWEHFRRLFRWQSVDFIHETTGANKWKFAYFWGWSFLKLLPFEFRRLGLDFYSAFWQLLFCIQIFRLCRKLGADRDISFVGVIACVFLFGTNVFSFRYYALSSTPLAYCAYLETLILVAHAHLTKTRIPLVTFVLLFLIAAFNHLQEAGFILLSNLVLLLSLKNKNQKTLNYAIVAGVVIGILTALVKDWYAKPLVMETFGVHGWIAIAVVSYLATKSYRLAPFFLFPTVLVLFPPTALLLSKTLDAGVIYRILYSVPLPLALVFGLDSLLRENWPGHIRLRRTSSVIMALVILLSVPSSFPWRGRLLFQTYHVPSLLSLRHLDPMAQWFAENRDLKKVSNCVYFTDPISNFILQTQSGGNEDVFADRFKVFKYSACADPDWAKNLTYTQNLPHFCGVLLHKSGSLPPFESSWIGASSKHWNADAANQSIRSCENLYNRRSDLNQLGWKKTEVPPFYELYEPN